MPFKDPIKARENARLRSIRYKAKHPERVQAASRRYEATHREERRLKALAYHASHRAEDRAYAAAHVEDNLAATARYRARHPERVRLSNAKNKTKNRARNRLTHAAYRRAHPEQFAMYYAQRRARKAQAPINDLTAHDWDIIKAHYGHRCVYCDRKMQRLTKDHIVPLSKGGAHTKTNVVPACASCNAKKGNRAVLKPVQPLLL